MQIKQYQTTKYIMGNGALREVQRWKDKKIGLVVDENVLKALQLETKLFDELLKDCDYEVLCNMPQEPTTELLEPAIRKAPSWIVRRYYGCLQNSLITLGNRHLHHML